VHILLKGVRKIPIPRTWSEELITEWLCLIGYSTEVGVPVGRGSRGGRKEADVIGVKIRLDDADKRILSIFHIEVGQLGGYAKSLEMISNKFSDTRTEEIIGRYKKRMAFEGQIEYEKVYVDIWDRPNLVKRLMNSTELTSVGIQVWSPIKLFQNIFTEIKNWGKYTLPESFWLLKLLESLLEVDLITARD